MPTILTFERPGVYRLRELPMAEHVSVSVDLVRDAYEALIKAEAYADAVQRSGRMYHSTRKLVAEVKALQDRLVVVLDHVRAQQRREADPYPEFGMTPETYEK